MGTAWGRYLKRNRLRKGLTLRDVTEMTGVNNSILSQWETGYVERIPPANKLKKLAKCYSCSMYSILKKAGYLDSKDDEINRLNNQLEYVWTLVRSFYRSVDFHVGRAFYISRRK